MRHSLVAGRGVMFASGGALLIPVSLASAACASIGMAGCIA
jgi:hypothetical protein